MVVVVVGCLVVAIFVVFTHRSRDEDGLVLLVGDDDFVVNDVKLLSRALTIYQYVILCQKSRFLSSNNRGALL